MLGNMLIHFLADVTWNNSGLNSWENLFLIALHSFAHKMAVEDDIFSAFEGLREQQPLDTPLQTNMSTNLALKVQMDRK